jgi:wyosine [tRNA(Phe)-imidazoG37] synthetase (radical SAM superfamily)
VSGLGAILLQMQKELVRNEKENTATPPEPAVVQPPNSTGQACLDTAFGRPRNFLNNRFAYGVISQRARGLSIGVNLNPDKKCNFDCFYCEVNRDEAPRDREIDVKVMSEELQNLLAMVYENRLREVAWFRNLPPDLLQLKGVALSGDGEPTLCPMFGEVVREVVHIRSQGRFPFFKITLITNTAGLHLPETRVGLHLLTNHDEIWVKLDAGTQDYMNKVNRPDIQLRKVLANILMIGRERPVIIQSLFPLMSGQEPPPEEIEQFVQRLQELKSGGTQISMVQVYSAHRPPHRGDCCGHLPLKSLSYIARRVREATGLKAEVF